METMQISRHEDYKEAINALRGFAALYVVLYHLRHFTDFDWFGTFSFIRYGYIGVDLFFILSGLIISHVYLHKAQTRDAAFWKKFFWFRIARLYPVHIFIMLLLLISALLAPLTQTNAKPVGTDEIIDWLSLALLVRQWFLPDSYSWNTPAWSVSAEFFAYIFIFPMVVLLTKKAEKIDHGSVLICSGITLFMVLLVSSGTVNTTSGAGPLIRVTAGFLLGCGIYLKIKEIHPSTSSDQFLFLSLMAILSLMLLLLYILPENRLVADIVIIAFATSLICSAYLAKGPMEKLLSGRWLFHFGEISFALYLCHVPTMGMLEKLADMLSLERGFWLGILMVVMSFAIAQLLYSFIEIPMRRIIRNWYIHRLTANLI